MPLSLDQQIGHILGQQSQLTFQQGLCVSRLSAHEERRQDLHALANSVIDTTIVSVSELSPECPYMQSIRDQQIQSITEQLRRLSIQQEELVSRLEELLDLRRTRVSAAAATARRDSELIRSAAAATVTRAGPASGSASRLARSFVEGDRVRILNPRGIQENNGIVIKVVYRIIPSSSRITVRTPNGTEISRAPINLALMQ